MKYILPMPPSVNAMYRRCRGSFGMYKTREAKSWIAQCYKIIKGNGFVTLEEKVECHIHFFFFREADIDNRIKSLLDLLEDMKIVENDRQVYQLHAVKDFDKKNPRVEIEICSKQ